MTHPDSSKNRDISEHLDQTFQYLGDLRQARHASGKHDRRLNSHPGLLPGSAHRALADEHWTPVFVSKSVEDLSSYLPDEFTSRRLSYDDSMPSEDQSATGEAVLAPAASAEDVLRRIPHPAQGRLGPLDIVARPRRVSLGWARFIEAVEPGQSTPEAAGWKQRALFRVAWR